MAYTFRVVFSGPCAYVPNIVRGDSGTVKSWSVLLPELRRGWPGDDDRIRADRHRSVLRYSPDDFEASTNPDAVLWIKNPDNLVYQNSYLFFLEGHRVTFDLPGAADLKVEDDLIDPSIRSDVDKIAELIATGSDCLRSMDWLPKMSWLIRDLEWFGRTAATDYFGSTYGPGYPNKDNIAAHILLKQGNLIADQLDTVMTNRGLEPTIWDFKPFNDKGKGIREQALAKSIALEVPMHNNPVSITMSLGPGIFTTLKLRQDKMNGTRSIEIKNRELEDIFLLEHEVERPLIDLDFRYLYSHAAGYRPDYLNYPIPHWVRGGGIGNEVGTCGGNRFSGFVEDFKSTLDSW